MKKLLFLLVFIPLVSFGQENYGSKSQALNLCTRMQSNFMQDKDAEDALKKIISVVGISNRFVLQSCSDIDNAGAITYKGIRYIIYDREFLKSINDKANASNLFILAHEVGHHVNGHTVDAHLVEIGGQIEPELKTLSNSKQEEIEADEFASFVLAKLGYSLEEISKPIPIIASDKSDVFSTHPNRTKRLMAVNNGYAKAFSENSVVDRYNNLNDKSEEYFYSSIKKYLNNDIKGAYIEYEKFVGNDSNEEEFNELIKEINSLNYKGRCSAITKAKKQCKRTAKSDSVFCWQHNDDNSDALIGRCEAITKAGTQCKRKASDDKGFCWQH